MPFLINFFPKIQFIITTHSPFKETRANENVGKYDGFMQLRRYMDAREANFIEGAERLFYTRIYNRCFNKYTAFTGTIRKY